MKVLVYTQYRKICVVFAHLRWVGLNILTKNTINFLCSVLFTIKMGSEFSLFSTKRLAVIKIDPAVIVPGRKSCDMLSLLSPSIFYHHILLLPGLRKILKVHFELRDTQYIVETFSFLLSF